ncbi:MAG: hypothetical protein AVDCRST_MAG77-3200 [uncultured Chloroflexi bacterium]|uniref:YfhO family protein n=1 Tax=uncultured Chloroflexota bacterium TaxID=166587 RepID=A0A6J4J5B7_9CHLR|nr:MAG: hypothetical protein AVDCRST_MAG77-3200 [uncultured Chloroflexota bacterium]
MAPFLVGALELTLLAVWAGYVARPYLNLDTQWVPAGREYLSNIQTHHFWTRLLECGSCAFWNGSFRGGYPALADPHGSMLHPLVAITTLIWGVFTGSKVALVAALFMAGVAQWWLAHLLRVSVVARLWTAGLAVAGGHLSGRMEPGNFGLLLSTAACALVLPAVMQYSRALNARAAAILSVTVASVAVSGQGYMQFGLVLVLPVTLLVLWRPSETGKWLRSSAVVVLLTALLSAPLLVPLVHFLPEFGKDTDAGFRSAQAFPYVPLNLVISDPKFYLSESLGKLPYPYLYTLYVGWMAVLMGAIGAGTAVIAAGTDPATERGRKRAERVFLVVYAVGALWVASAAPLQWLISAMPWRSVTSQLVGLRYPPVIAGLAVPPLLGLSAVGYSRVEQWARERYRTMRLKPRRSRGPAVLLGLTGSALLPLALLFAAWGSLLDAQRFSGNWLTVQRQSTDLRDVLMALKTSDAQWVNTPYGEQFWIEPAVAFGLKLNLGTQGWYWKGRQPPPAVREAHRQVVAADMTLKTTVGGVPIWEAFSGREYAAVVHADGQRTVCAALAAGGHIDVTCGLSAAGTLTVRENNWSGWRASVDGEAAPLLPGTWLQVALPAGQHRVGMRYEPLDVTIGVMLFAIGGVMVFAMVLGLGAPGSLRHLRRSAHRWKRAPR